MNINLKADINIHDDNEGRHGMHEILERLKGLAQRIEVVIEKENQIMATQVEIDAALTKIDEATTKQGVVLLAQGDTLQIISDEMDRLIAEVKSGNITPAQVSRLQALADGAQVISNNLDAQSIVSKAIATKGAANPVPVPVPDPTPVPTP